MAESKQRKAFEEFVDKVQIEFEDSLKKLYLYGSVARGEESDESDVDILAVVETKNQKRKLQDLAFETGLEYEVSFSPIVKTEEEYQKVKDTVYGREVRSTGEIRV